MPRKTASLDLSKIRPSAKFGQFAKLRVPDGRDRYSSMRFDALVECLGSNSVTTIERLRSLWEGWDDADRGKIYPLTDREVGNILRWHLRGLSIESAVRKGRVDFELFGTAASRPRGDRRSQRKPLPKKPGQCLACRFFSNNGFLSCAVNPFAFGSDDCPDFQKLTKPDRPT